MPKQSKTFSVHVDSELLRLLPILATLPMNVDANEFNAFLVSLEAFCHLANVSVFLSTIKVVPKFQGMRGRTDYLGLEHMPRSVADVCDVIREATGVDPRSQLLYSKRGSAYEGLSDQAMVHKDPLKQRFLRKDNPLSPRSTEELVIRRRLAESNWDRKRFIDAKRRKAVHDQEKREDDVKEFFFTKKDAKP